MIDEKRFCPLCKHLMKKGYFIFECQGCGALVKTDGEIIYNPKDHKPIIGEPK